LRLGQAAALAAASNIMEKSGQAFVVAGLAQEYSFEAVSD
jgi:hypothetical protein